MLLYMAVNLQTLIFILIAMIHLDNEYKLIKRKQNVLE